MFIIESAQTSDETTHRLMPLKTILSINSVPACSQIFIFALSLMLFY